MQRFYQRVVTSARISRWKGRFLSSIAPSCENGDVLPEMPYFDHTPAPYNGPSASDLLKRRREYLPTCLGPFYDNPLNLVEGKMQYVFDENGRRYLDALGGIATVSCGHCHPDVVEAIVNQTRLLQHTTVVYLNHTVIDFAEALASKLPGELKVVFFTNSGQKPMSLL